MAAARGDLEYRVPVRAQDEVGAVAHSFNFMMEDLKVSKERLVIAERIAAWQEIARRLAHEIKNPLTPIQMAMDTLRKTWRTKHPSFDEILEESTTTVLQEADRLKRICFRSSPILHACLNPNLALCRSTKLLKMGWPCIKAPMRWTCSSGICPRSKPTVGNCSKCYSTWWSMRAMPWRNGLPRVVGRARSWFPRRLPKDRIEWVVQDNGIGVPADSNT